jgi:hypothetical protein
MHRDVVVRRTERWLVRQGLPQLIADYRFRSHVLPRMLPFLAGVVVVSALLSALARARPGIGVLIAGMVVLSGLLAVPVVLARMRRRLPWWSRTGTTIVLVAYGLTPVVIPLLLLGAYGKTDTALQIGRPGTGTAEVAVVSGLVLVVAFAATFVVAGLATAYGVVPLAVLATRHALGDMRSSLQLQGRAMPALLFVTFFLFFTGELWQLMNHLAWGRLGLVLVLFAAVTLLATSTRLRGEIDRVEQDLSPERLVAACSGTPLAVLDRAATPPSPPPLTARQETNVLLVLATRQLIQAAVVGLGLFAFFVILGLIVVDDTTAAAWIGGPPQRSAWVPFMPVALFRVAALLAGFGSMYFAITTMTQEGYRHEFFEPVIEDVERALAVRAVYLGLRAARVREPAAIRD